MAVKHRDGEGRFIGYTKKDEYGRTVHTNAEGRVTGYTRKDEYGRTVHTNAAGRTTGYTRKDEYGRSIHTDAEGRVTGYSDRDYMGRTIHHDSQGRVTGFDEPNMYGSYGTGQTPTVRIKPGYAPVTYRRSALEKAEGHALFAALLVALIATAYMLLSFFIKALPVSFALIIAVPILALFAFSALMKAADCSSFWLYVFALLLMGLFYMLHICIDCTDAPAMSGKGEYLLLYGVIALFAAALFVGWLVGRSMRARLTARFK